MIAVLIGIPAGCEKETVAPPPAKPSVAPGKGVVVGSVVLKGAIPKMKDIPNSACHPGGPLVREESVVATEDGKLANVVVYVKDGPNVVLPPADAVVLDQVGCQYVPHVVALRTGQMLTARSSDPMPHNVYGQCTINPAFNVGMTGVGQTHSFTFSRPEMFKVRCDVHPWMSGHVAVFDHPLFAVSRADGTFKIEHLPAGQYTLVAWHERYGTKETPITIGADDAKPVSVSFEYP